MLYFNRLLGFRFSSIFQKRKHLNILWERLTSGKSKNHTFERFRDLKGVNMYRVINFINRKWNSSIFLFHDLATKSNINFLVKFSIWAHDRMIWELPERVQLIGGIPVSEQRLQRELD